MPVRDDLPSGPAAGLEFDGDGGRVLLCHGFTSTPASLAPWAEAFAEAGFAVRVPRLPGHGTTWQEMNRTGWPDWYRCVERALLDLSSDGSSVVVGGLSMGGALALRLAMEHPDRVSALVLANPCIQLTDPRLRVLPVVRRFVPSLAAIAGDIRKLGVVEVAYDRTPLHALASSLLLFREVRARLGEVTAPILVARSAVDHIVPVANGREVLARVSSRVREDLELTDSYHVATLDNDAPLLFERSVAFARAMTQPATTQPGAVPHS